MSTATPPPRYSRIPLPVYRYVPGRTPHPRRDPAGHSYGTTEPVAAPWAPGQWRALEPWLYGVDLFNTRYWWEAHEQHEALWHAAGRTTAHARFVQGVIKVAAGCLNFELGKGAIANEQVEAGLTAMLAAPCSVEGTYMGMNVRTFADETSKWLASGGTQPLVITLEPWDDLL